MLVQSPFNHSTYSKQCLDSKVFNLSKISKTDQHLPVNPSSPYSQTTTPFSQKNGSPPSVISKENEGLQPVMMEPRLADRNKRQKREEGRQAEENNRKFKPKVSNPKKGFNMQPFADFATLEENHCYASRVEEDSRQFMTGKFYEKEDIIQRQIERFDHSKKIFEQKMLRLKKEREGR